MIGEERGGEAPAGGAPYWLVDPICGTRNCGTTLAYVAAGRISAYVLFSASAIHTAAGSLLVTEAGGALSDIDGQPWSIVSDSTVASADADLHGELLARIRTESSVLLPT